MNILEQAKRLYDKCNNDMFQDITRYMAYGHVFISPSQFLLLKLIPSINGKWRIQMPGMFTWQLEK
jgi:hypothetical protein